MAKYYPSPSKTGALNDDFRLLFNHVYALQDSLAEAKGRIADMEKSHKSLSDQVAAGPSTTKIQGLNVKGVPPTNGQVLTYNSATGDIEWM